MKMKLNHYYAPTPRIARQIGDAILYGCTALQPVVMGAPLTDSEQKWIITTLAFVGVIGKFVSNLFKDETPPTDEQKP